MDLCKIVFGKSINDLSYKDIENYFSEEKSESDQIEYKSINEKADSQPAFQKLAETVCGFLNSNGGVLVWGAPRGIKEEKRNEKVFVGPLTPSFSLIEKDKFINKISNLITPIPNNINVKPIVKGENYIYIIEVGESEYAPHQTNEKYFMRIDGQTRVAPHHYVEALFKKIKFPNLEGYLSIKHIFHRDNVIFQGIKGNFYEINFRFLIFNWTPFQNEENVYARILTDVGRFQFDESLQAYHPSLGEFSGKVTNILSYGSPVEFVKTLFYNKIDLRGIKNESKLLLTIGGKICPLKASTYNINFNHFEGNKDLKECISPIYTNKFFKDLDDQKGNIKEKIMHDWGLI